MRPRIVGCTGLVAQKVEAAWMAAARLAESAVRWLIALARSSKRRQMWRGMRAAVVFGPFRLARVRRILKVFVEALRRLRQGYRTPSGRRRPTIECLGSGGRCGKGLLGNASIYGRIRLCPRLLERSVEQIAAVVLHEVMHHRLGVGDQRPADCVGDRKQRCYREHARTLVAADRFDLATRNIDNFVLFARAIARSK